MFDEEKIESLEDLKSQYRKLCKVHHPDVGGDANTFRLLNDQFSIVKKRLGEIIEKNAKRANMLYFVRQFDGDDSKIIVYLPREAYERGAYVRLVDKWLGEEINFKIKPDSPEGFRAHKETMFRTVHLFLMVE